MNFKVNMLITLSLGLILGLFGSFLRGMELEDAQGKRCTLNLGQFQALSCCAAFKEMSRQNGPISFKTDYLLPQATVQNLTQLAHLIAHPKEVATLIDTLTDSQRIALFTLANYMEAPAGLTQALALGVYYNTRQALAALSKKQPFAGPLDRLHATKKLPKLQELHQRAHQNLPYFPDFDAFLEMHATHTLSQLVDYYPEGTELDLSPGRLLETLNCSKKIAGLKGIERLKECPWASQITHISAPQQLIGKFKVSTLRAIFPALQDINFSNNCVKELSHKTLAGMPAHFTMNLSNNLIHTIHDGAIQEPGQLQHVEINTQNNLITRPVQKTIFKQSVTDRMATWCKACAAKSVVAGKSFVQNYDWIGNIICGAIAISVPTSLKYLSLRFPLSPRWDVLEQRLDVHDAIGLLNIFRILAGNADNADIVSLGTDNKMLSYSIETLLENIQSLLTKTSITFDSGKISTISYSLAKLHEALAATDSQNIFQQPAIPWGSIAKYAIGFGVKGIAVWTAFDLFYGLLRFHITRDLNLAAAADPYRVRVMNDTRNVEFPSNYAYKLFDKN